MYPFMGPQCCCMRNTPTLALFALCTLEFHVRAKAFTGTTTHTVHSALPSGSADGRPMCDVSERLWGDCDWTFVSWQ